MKFNLSHLRRIAVDNDYTTLKHPSGHEIKIAHKNLQPKMRGELEAVPMAEGGPVEEQAPEAMTHVPYEKSPEIEQEMQNIETAVQSAEPQQAQAPEAVPQTPQYSVPEPTENFSLAPAGQGINSSKNDPYGVEAGYQAYSQGQQEQRRGLEKQAEAESQQARESIPALQRQQDQLQTLSQLHEEHMNSLNKERESLMTDALKGHINPNQFWEEKSVPGKIGTIVGMLIGGLGGSDAPMKLLQTQIDRNIQAQKLNLENKHNLLNANRAQFQNERDAVDMTKVMTNDQVSNQIKLAAARATDPMAKARLLQSAGQLDKDSYQITGQTAMRRSMMTGQKNGTLDPETLIRFSPVIPEGEKEAAFKELGEAQATTKAKDNILSAFDQISKLNTVGNRVGSPLQSSESIKAIKDPIVASLSKGTAGRFTEADAGMLETLFPTLKDGPQSLAVKRQRLNALVSEKMNFPRLKSLGIDPTSHGRFNGQGQSGIPTAAPIKPGSKGTSGSF